MSGTVERTDGTKIKISRPVKVVENGSLVDPDTDTKVKQTIELKPVDVANPKAGYSIFDDFDIISVSGAKVNGVAAPKIIFSDKTKTYQLNFKIGDTLFTREIRVHGTTDDNASATPTGEAPANSSTDPNQNTTAPTTNPSDKSATDENDGKTTTPETDETKATDDDLADPNLGAEISEVKAPLIKAYAVTDDHPTARVNMVTNLNAKLANTTMTPQDLDSLGVGLTTAGDYTFVATVTNSQGKPVTITQPVTILADGTAGAIETPTSQVTQTIRLQDFEVRDTKVGMPIFKTMDIKAANGTKVEGSSIPTIKFPARAATYELTYQVGATKFVQLVKVNPTQTV
ncbi:hypothetical protein [Limosilactobacillus ingluviei]|uniref:hypothetical protein n=1 Tax=Limosilactobacillus ingluviei TaxID=148604 RepID=UPI000704F1E1|nr:hypothetical protein [Limosilactobacillus ingluviei]